MLKCRICGMIISEKNYFLNSDAIPEKNQLEEIKYCPFCGVSSEYLDSVDKETMETNKEELNEDTIKILNHAMQLEVFNGDFYKQVENLVEDEYIKKMFNSLYKIEMMHAKIHQRMGGFKELPKLTQLNYSKYKGKGGDKDFIELAKKREIHAIEYYKKYMEKVNDLNLKKVFSALSKVEEAHVDIEEKAL